MLIQDQDAGQKFIKIRTLGAEAVLPGERMLYAEASAENEL